MEKYINKHIYTVLHDGLNPIGKVVSLTKINTGDEIAFGANHLKVVASNQIKREIVVSTIGNINVVELYDMKMKKVEYD